MNKKVFLKYLLIGFLILLALLSFIYYLFKTDDNYIIKEGIIISKEVKSNDPNIDIRDAKINVSNIEKIITIQEDDNKINKIKVDVNNYSKYNEKDRVSFSRKKGIIKIIEKGDYSNDNIKK